MNSISQKFIGTLYLKDGKIISSLDSSDVYSEDPVNAAVKFAEEGADEIFVFDLSPAGDDASHEAAIDIIKDICKAVDVNVTAAGNVKRMEDIKKLLYAGCKKACLNFSKAGNIEILKEVSEKFGKEKIGICFSAPGQINDNSEEIVKFASELFCLEGEVRDNSELNVELPVSVLCASAESCEKNLSEKNKDTNMLKAAFSWADLKKNSDGMVPVIVQDYRTDQVLMLAYMNEVAYNLTLKTGKMTYFSRSRNQLWLKGETSSHFQYVKSLCADCDMDTILAKVKQIGAACHTGSYSCFFNEIAGKEYIEKNPQKVLDSVFAVIKDRKVNPREGSYTNYLFDKGLDKILKKVGEEATEMVIAAKNPNSNEIIYEMSDFLYHMMVLMAEKDVSWEDVTDELSRR